MKDRPKSILIADDEYDIALSLELVLTAEGYQVTTVSNGREALTRIAEVQPDLVMLDVMMPVMTGLEALERIRADARLKDLPVVVMSAAPVKGAQAQHGWDEFLRKPFNVDRLLEVLARLLPSK